MKLSTMILPTGEFVILAGEADENEPGFAESMTRLRDSTGAACVYSSAGPLAGADAVYDENAVRCDPDPIQHLFDAGADFTPAGLVDHRSLAEIVEQDVLGQDARTRQRGLVAGVERAPAEPGLRDSPDSPMTTELHEMPVYEPKIGDRVRLHGKSELGYDCDGEEATVSQRLGSGYWEVRRDNNIYNHYQAKQMELISRG